MTLRAASLIALLPVLALPIAAQAQTTASVQPPSPAQTISIPAGTIATWAKQKPDQLVTFQSKLSNDSKDKVEGWIWKPATATASAKVPLVIVAHGHSGSGTYASPSTQFQTLAKQMIDLGVGVMLVNSFSSYRNDYVLNVAKYPADFTIVPGLNDDRTKRPPEASDHKVRPYDVVGAAEYVRAGNLPWVDADKLVGVGYSHGGTAFLGAALSKHPVNIDNPQGGGRLFKKLFISYPGCGMDSLNNYKGSASVVPAIIGIGSADASVSPAYCTSRQAESVSVANLNPSLYAFEYWLYANGVHTWESKTDAVNKAIHEDWRKKIGDYVTTLKAAP
ncbi:hypothetical protein ACFSM5_12830 [Lacibacterium aquatile]|uniref:Uncharacterized protein n=1 Tax=Lacibacterium aquatile TaxID=1168082 RepID=A0ABW5DSZ6_9PROT